MAAGIVDGGEARMKMSWLAVAGAAAVVLAVGPAAAADLAPPPVYKMPVKAPVAPVYDWTGFYVGGNVGYGWGRSSDTSTLADNLGIVHFTSSDSTNLDGVVGGGQIGYNWQRQNWLWGLEADIQGADQKGNRSFICPVGVCTPLIISSLGPPGLGPAVPVTMSQRIDWFGTVRGRVGVLATPSVLFYATGGLAYGEVNTSETIGEVTASNIALQSSSFSSSDTRLGYAVGAGVEGVIGGNWTAKLEYLFVDLGRTSGSFAVQFPTANITSSFSSHITDNLLRVGVNYKFGGPAFAKY
jgi:outer membrane immunogenic protein